MAWMIYGANGFTGELIARAAVEAGHKPVLAGRRVSKIAPLATALGLDHRVFDLADRDAACAALEGVDLVLHCAGPFSQTSEPMLDACLRTKTHYLDITGEIGVFESIFARTAEVRAAGIVAIPGVGFDVVPTDALASRLAEVLPGATQLELAFIPRGGGLSRGTALTTLEGLDRGGAARIDGRIKRVPMGWRRRSIEIEGRTYTVASIPWGDVSTAYHSTGIPNITLYGAFPKLMVFAMRASDGFLRMGGALLIKTVLSRFVEQRMSGPDQGKRAKAVSWIWGRVQDDEGRSAQGLLRTPDGYDFTVQSSLGAVERVLQGTIAPGSLTPSLAFGNTWLERISGVQFEPITLR